jgi:hypothetical protein
LKNVYVILSRSNTILARMIRLFTQKRYSHTSFALDKRCEPFYSFGRRYPRLMFPTGFITEGMASGFFKVHPKVPAAVYEIPVTGEQYALIEERLKPFIADPLHYKYSIVNIFLQARGIPLQRENKYVCSAFVAYLLEGIVDFGKDISLVYPHEFQEKGFKLIYEGLTKDYAEFCESLHETEEE